jgi:hypothetical protein
MTKIDYRKIKEYAEKVHKEKTDANITPWVEFNMPGETFIGILEEIRNVSWENTDFIYTVKDINTDKLFSLKPHVILMKQIYSYNPKIGDLIYVEYLGIVPCKESNNKYNNYLCAVIPENEIESFHER